MSALDDIKILLNKRIRQRYNQSVGTVISPNEYADVLEAVSEKIIVGTPTSSFAATHTAGMNLSSGRAVVQIDDKMYYFNPDNPQMAGRAIGVTNNSALNGEQVQVQFFGPITDAAFLFTPDSVVYIASGGVLQTVYPSTVKIVQVAGVATGLTSMQINFQLSIIRI